MNWNFELLVFLEQGKLENSKKNPWNKSKTNNKLNPHLVLGWNQTQAPLMGIECSHHCAISAPQIKASQA